MRVANPATALPATDQLVARATDRTVLRGLFGRMRSAFTHKPSVELSQALSITVRSAERLFAGDRSPDAIALWRLMDTPWVKELLLERARHMTPERRREFWDEVRMAELRAAHRKDLDETI